MFAHVTEDEAGGRIGYDCPVNVTRNPPRMFGQIPPTQYDWNFRAFDVPVRVHPVFWLSSAFLAWSFARGGNGEMFLPKLIVGILCIFIAILVHELGHALMTRRFGWRPEIVLYFFGGYATSMRHSTWKDIAVSAAGPLAGFALYGISWGLLYVYGADLAVATIQGNQMAYLAFHALVVSKFINLVWNLANLLPVEPLDGGQIARELWLRYGGRDGMGKHLSMSIVVAGAVTGYCVYCLATNRSVFGLDPMFLAFMFGYLCVQNYQTYEQYRRGGGYW